MKTFDANEKVKKILSLTQDLFRNGCLSREQKNRICILLKTDGLNGDFTEVKTILRQTIMYADYLADDVRAVLNF